MNSGVVMKPTVASSPRVHTEAPPDPLPEQWVRAVANSIASELRRGWRAHTVKRAISSAPITGKDYHPTGRFTGPAPTWELVSRELYAFGLTDAIPALEVPAIAWHLTQLDLAEVLNARGLMQHAATVDAWLRHKPRTANQPAALYRLKPNRHGRLMLRRNSDHAPAEVAQVFLAAVEAATITVPDPLDVADLLAEWDRISPETVFALAS